MKKDMYLLIKPALRKYFASQYMNGVSIDRYVSFPSPNVFLHIPIFHLSICLLTDTVFNKFQAYVTD